MSNIHLKMAARVLKRPVERQTPNMYTMINYSCPYCKAPKEHYCHSVKSGSRANAPHIDRIDCYIKGEQL